MGVDKQVLKKYLGKLPTILDLRKKSIVKDKIDLSIWEKNMQYLENDFNWNLRESAHPLVCTIKDGEALLPPVLYRTTDKNWFIAAYPDVIMHFYPTVDLAIPKKELINKTQEVEEDFQKLQEYLDKFKLNQTLSLVYIKRFYSEVLRKEFLLSENRKLL